MAHDGPQLELEDANDIIARRGIASLLGATDAEAAYYWANVAYAPELAAGPPGAKALRAPSGSPTVVHVRHGTEQHTLAVRGSCELSDFATVLALRGLHGRLQHAYCEGTRHVTHAEKRGMQDAFAHVCASIAALPPNAHVHPGIIVHAFKCLMLVWPVLESTPPSAVFLYGHSLGAACASLLYVWLRELGIVRPEHASCAVLACPMFANTAAWASWLRQHDGPSYTHYFMDGDPFVSDLPGMVGLDRAVSRTHHVCPNIYDMIAGARGATRDALTSHSCFLPGASVRVDGTGHDNIKRALASSMGPGRKRREHMQRVLISPKHVQRVLRLHAAGCPAVVSVRLA